MKRLIVAVGFLMVFLSAGLLAQTADKVEKAVRFRVQQNKNAVVVTSESTGQLTETPAASAEEISPEHGSNTQLKELGGYLWNNNTAQLNELGPRWRWWGNVEQLNELGPRWKWWSNEQLNELGPGRTFNAAQLEELGPRWRWWSSEQLNELGPRWRWW